MRAVLAAPLLLLAPRAFAAWPNDVSLSGMERHGGALLSAPVTDDYVTLIRELGAGLASWPALPANTTAIDGFDAVLGTSFWFIDAYPPEGADPTIWQRVHPDEKPESFQTVPSLIVRKGLPMSLEIGGGMSWFAGSGQGAVHAFGRLGVLEGHLPWPELAVQVGYTGYVGNDELEIGVFEAGATLGTSVPLTRWTGVTQSVFSPYLGAALLSIRSTAVVDPDLADRVGIVSIGGPDADQPAITAIRVQGGFQVVSGPAVFRLNGAWTTDASLILSIGTGLHF